MKDQTKLLIEARNEILRLRQELAIARARLDMFDQMMIAMNIEVPNIIGLSQTNQDVVFLLEKEIDKDADS